MTETLDYTHIRASVARSLLGTIMAMSREHFPYEKLGDVMS